MPLELQSKKGQLCSYVVQQQYFEGSIITKDYDY